MHHPVINSSPPTVSSIAERLRQEPFCAFSLRQNCWSKSFRFRYQCRKAGIPARVVLALTITKTSRFRLIPVLLTLHAWGEVNNRKIEVARPLDVMNKWGSFDIDAKPYLAIWI